MKLSYRLKIGLITILIVSFFLALNLTSKEVKNFFYLISSPIQKVLWGTGERISDFLGVMGEIRDLKRENEKLRQKTQKLLAEIGFLRELKRENEILREALGIGLERDFQLVLAEVIGKDIFQDTILINRGRKDGISEGMPVITQEKALVGKIERVYRNFSKVLLISNQKSSFDGKISNTDIYGIIKGEGNLEVSLRLIPLEKEIQKGDLMITSALGGVFPSRLLVGEIKEVKKSDLEPFQIAQIQPTFNIRDLRKLFIITEW